MILNKTPRPPPTQHDSSTRNECFRGSVASKILTFLTCMPAGDSKNEPHQEKKPSFFFQRGRAINMETHISSQRGEDSIAQCDAQRWRLCMQRLSARPAKERKKRNNNQKVYFLFLLKRGALLAKER